MKRCPSCQHLYADDTLVYCLEDGSTLVSEGGSGADMPATVIMQDPRATSPVVPETFRQGPGQTLNPPQNFAPAQQPSAWPHAAGGLAPAAPLAGYGRGAAVTSLVCAIAAFALLAFCFIGGPAGVADSLIGGIFIFAAAVALAGAIVGIIAVARTGKDTNPRNSKATAVVGLVLNCLYLLITLLFLVLGAAGSL